jgi:hypothetical protein
MSKIECEFCYQKYDDRLLSCSSCGTKNPAIMMRNRPIVIRQSSSLFPVMLIILFLGLTYYLLPYYTAFQIKEAIDEKNVKKLNNHVDYPALRENLKNQLNAYLVTNAVSEEVDNPFTALAIPLMAVFAGKMIDGMITPEGIIALAEQDSEEKNENRDSNLKEPTIENIKNLAVIVFQNPNLGYETLSRFRITIEKDNGDDNEFYLTRSGLEWKVTEINLPKSKLNFKGKNKKNKNGSLALIDGYKQKENSIKKERLRKLKARKLEKAKYFKFVQLSNIRVADSKKNSFEEPEKGIFGTITNKGSRTLKEVKVTIYFLDSNGTRVGEKDYSPVFYSKYSSDEVPLKPNYVKDFGYKLESYAPSNWSGKIEYKIAEIDFWDKTK